MRTDIAILDRLVRCIDLTSLSGDETETTIASLCDRAVQNKVAAVCIYPEWVRFATRRLGKAGVALATVVNFPRGEDDQDGIDTAIMRALEDGADEIDLVAPLDAIEDGDIELVTDMVQRARECARGHAIKVILETGRLQDPTLITAAARAAVMGGANFLKTSTGKSAVGATPEAVSTLMDVIVEADGSVGLKLSGGVRTTKDALQYRQIVAERIGADWLVPENFRLGASSLLDAILASRRQIRGTE